MSMASTDRVGVEEALRLQFEIEQLYAREAHLLDERRFEQWLDLFADDFMFRVPIAQNVAFNALEEEYLEDALAISWIHDDKPTMAKRVEQIRTGVHWAEEPLSRTVHLVSNVLIDVVESDDDGPLELDVKSGVLSYRHRLTDQEDTVVGRRHDRLRRIDDVWLISGRTLYISQTVYLGSSFSHFI
ncbi:3-phenylpropionate/cinnamic acid dioxygenase subunit beta [Aeromicrobium phragmitis]|uniref:3-phenylpropionate/cinnamic acid dioxygenase subunit beta n=1 Tax=Aeromicrobium phragmitis TaxID=2478914 RepID=A0A3L8PHQ9_9ACTN|nr:3-phenylpropionate/cinnamic acid dioxygenase subunit beta [Aeromicrobium phragmitis]RLV54560.1 3-phenylpropionate/cinnamic acid dioxygenase subunit beta [Aeromicrobium phragmitis]